MGCRDYRRLFSTVDRRIREAKQKRDIYTESTTRVDSYRMDYCVDLGEHKRWEIK
jgi:hypothetical protein